MDRTPSWHNGNREVLDVINNFYIIIQELVEVLLILFASQSQSEDTMELFCRFALAIKPAVLLVITAAPPKHIAKMYIVAKEIVNKFEIFLASYFLR